MEPTEVLERRTLSAGAVELELDGVDLRYARAGGGEILRRVYVAVRDPEWTTIPGELTAPVAVEQSADRFRAEFSLRHVAGEIDFAWSGELVGEPDGAVRFSFRGRAARAFRYNRIGFCVLHPVAPFAGQPYRARTPAGEVIGTMPLLVEPQLFEHGVYVPFIPACSELQLTTGDGTMVSTRFEGDLFEVEDQRNWSDASYKTYCTPLSLGVPRRAQPGQEFAQSVELRVAVPRTPRSGGRRAAVASAAIGADAPDLVVGEPTGRRLPPIGTCLPDHDDHPPAGLLRGLGLQHLRVDVAVADTDATVARLNAAVRVAERLGPGLALELGLYARADDDAALDALAGELAALPVARAIVLDADARSATPTETASAALVALVRRAVPVGVPVLAGTDMNFCELNRTRPQLRGIDGVAYPVAATVHACDDRSILETPVAQADAVVSARELAGGLPVAVGPITLRPRFNPHALDGASAAAAVVGRLPAAVDARQRAQLTAAFMVASVARLAQAGAAALTYFELSGWEGIVERASGAPLPRLFPSAPGEPFPVARVFQALAGRTGAPLRRCTPRDPLAAAGIALQDGDALRVVVANLADRARTLRLRLPASEREIELDAHTIAIIDEETP